MERRDSILVVFTVLALAMGAAVTTASRSLWEPDETRYAEVAREMRETGEFALLRLNGEPYTHKPPLFIWAEAGLQSLGLPTTAAGVVPAFLALMLLFPALSTLGTATGLGRRSGVLAFVILVSSPLVAATGMLARMDILLALSHTVALVGLAGLLLGSSSVGHGRRAHLLLWAAIGIGVLIKGPVALVMPLLTAVLVWLLLRPRPSLAGVFLGWGPVLALLIVLAWLIPAALAGGAEVLRELVVTQSAGRLTNSFAHREPFYFHLITYPFTGLPWSPLVVVAAVAALRRRHLNGPSFLAVAALSVFVFFSLVSGKLEIYLLPLFPAASLLVAASLQAIPRRWPWLLGALALTLLGVGVAVAPHLRPELASATSRAVVAGILLTLVAGFALLRSLRRARNHPPLRELVVAGLTIPVIVIPALAGAVDGSMSVRAAAEAFARLEPVADQGFSYGVELAGLPLYSRRRFTALNLEADLAAVLAQGRCVAILERDWKRLPPELQNAATEVFRQQFRRRSLLVVRGGIADS